MHTATDRGEIDPTAADEYANRPKEHEPSQGERA